MALAKMSFHGDSNVGLYGIATDKYCILGNVVLEKDVKKVKEVLDVPVIQMNLYGTPLVGIFGVATSDKLLLPNVVFDSELKELKKKLPKGVEVYVMHTENSALGNNIVINDKAMIISTAFSKEEVKALKEIFPKHKIEQKDLSELNVPGSCGIVTNKGALFSQNLDDDEVKAVEKLFKMEIGIGTANMGNALVKSAILANSNGFIFGANTSGYEAARIDESLGFLK